MAEGYARATGKPGVVIVTSGPGGTNTITPMQDALMDGTPMIVFSGQVVTHAIGTDAFQEADMVGISRPCTKWNHQVKDISDLPRVIDEAFRVATTGRPGPVLIDLPKDVTAGTLTKAVSPPTKHVLTEEQKSGKFTKADIQHAARLINIAKKPIIYAGQGVNE
jgi:acetolactate synthase-1/2/3 large subunit